MSLVFWRSVNGYMYPSNLGAPNGAGTTAAYYPYLSAASPATAHHAGPTCPATATAAACQALAPLSGAGPTSIPSALALAAAAAGNPASQAHKWMLPGYMSSQQMYMYLPKISKPKTERINKAVKCDICNLTLNSELQAQQHYNGKNHLKKMKQLGMSLPGEEEGKKVIQQYTSEANSEGNEDSSQGDGTESGNGNQSEETDGSQQESIEDRSESPTNGSQTQAQTPDDDNSSHGDIDQQQPPQQPPPEHPDEQEPAAEEVEEDQQEQHQPQDDNPEQQEQHVPPQQQQHIQEPPHLTVIAAEQQHPQQSQPEKLDPVSQAVYDNLLGKLPRKRKMEIPCCVCDMIFNSEAQASQHFRGVRHAKRLKMSEDFKTSPPKPISDGEASPEGSSSSESKSSIFYCHYCGVALNSTQQMDEHKEGQHHKRMVERKSGGQTRRQEEEGEEAEMHCEICDIRVPSPSMFQEHLSCSEHVERMQGHPLEDCEDSSSPLPSPTSCTTTSTTLQQC